MSLKYEQYRALKKTRAFLHDLIIGGYPKELRDRAYTCARHFPVLAKNGEPIFSRDDFECPDLED